MQLDPDEIAQKHRLSRAFADDICDKHLPILGSSD